MESCYMSNCPLPCKGNRQVADSLGLFMLQCMMYIIRVYVIQDFLKTFTHKIRVNVEDQGRLWQEKPYKKHQVERTSFYNSPGFISKKISYSIQLMSFLNSLNTGGEPLVGSIASVPYVPVYFSYIIYTTYSLNIMVLRC